MFALHIFTYLLIHLTFTNSVQPFTEQFLYKDNSPKCCKPEEKLKVNSSDVQIFYECVPDNQRVLHVETATFLLKFLRKFSSQTNSCVDVIEDEATKQNNVVKIDGDTLNMTTLNLNYLPKCCPMNSVYDLVEHKCVKVDEKKNPNYATFAEEVVSEHISNGLFLMKIGLSECSTVIADYEIQSMDELTYNENKGIYLNNLNETTPYGAYCIDKVYNSQSYVARICHPDLTVCRRKKTDIRKFRCIRKCCLDGMMYKNSSKCSFSFEHGLNLREDPKIQHSDEPFVIIPQQNCRKYLVGADTDYTLNEMGSIHVKGEEQPDLFYSPLTSGYCYENVVMSNLKGLRLFLCLSF